MSNSRIRKDGGKLTLADWDFSPVWEFCHDEEDVDGQDESTVRPSDARAPISWPECDCGISSDMIFACGKTFRGVLWLSASSMTEDAKYNSEICFDDGAAKMLNRLMPDEFDPYLHKNRLGVAFRLALAEFAPDEHVLPRLNMIYQCLGVSHEQMWPITVRPRAAIKGWPATFELHGWRRADGTLLR